MIKLFVILKYSASWEGPNMKSNAPSIINEPGVSPGCYLDINRMIGLSFPELIVKTGTDNFPIVLQSSLVWKSLI